MEQGQVHIYTGDGKGKTTAAIGLAVRALGAGKTVYMGQFIKDMQYHEIEPLRTLGAQVELYGSGDGCFIEREPAQKDLDAATCGIKKLHGAITSQQYDLVIADEINVAWMLHLVSEEEMLSLIAEKPENVELVLTGRGCPPRVLERADLITEMKEIRHYYNTKGLLARDGVER